MRKVPRNLAGLHQRRLIPPNNITIIYLIVVVWDVLISVKVLCANILVCWYIYDIYTLVVL